jgi:alpha-galactosidase
MTSRIVLPLLVATSLAAPGFELINVNFNGFTGGNPGPTQDANTLEGPAGGLGTAWNQYAAKSSSGVVVDSTGAPTTVTVTTNFSEGRYDGTAPTLTMLRATLTDFAKGATNRTVTISGLEANGSYNIWLVSHRHQSTAAERQAGIWSTTHATSSPNTQTVDGRAGALNGASFVPGVNFALFQSIVANGSGVITFTGAGGSTSNGFDASYRMHLNGIQIAPAAPPRPPEPLEFTDIVRDPASGAVTLTWKSNPGEKYGLYWTTDLDGIVMHGTHHAIAAHATERRTTIGPVASPLPAADKLFFLVGPPDLSNPALSQAFGSGNTVTLQFSEAIHPDSAGNLANFGVTIGGVAITIQSATLDASGKNIILTLNGSLQAGTSYDVTAQNITTPAGRVIPTSFNRSFQTWDNDPNGIQVFILAGQSNMVGHGKTEIGRNPSDTNDTNFPGGLGCLRNMAVNDTDGIAPHYRNLLVDPSQPATSAWKTRNDVKVWWRDSDLEAARAVIKGDLKIGYSQSRNPEWIGPEYGFGWVVGEALDKPVLIIKTAWGGKSLNVDFRPPGATARGGSVGPYYSGMLSYVRDCLSNLATEFPAAQNPEFAAVGYRYRIAGFGWHQGWNDRVDATASANYRDNLVDLIKDLRAEFANPDLPVSITTTAMDPPATYTAVELAQLAVADPANPAFVSKVKTTDARPFWRLSTVSPSNFGYHWNHNGESQFLNGTAMGQKMLELLGP